MAKRWLIVSLLAAALPGCVVLHVESDPDALCFATAWEMPRLAQQPVQWKFAAEGQCGDRETAGQEALQALLDSCKFRLAGADEKPACSIDVTLAVRRRSRPLATVCGALILYAWPVVAEDHVCEAFGVVRRPSGEVVARCYAQSRGAATVWLGNLFLTRKHTNNEARQAARLDALKAVTVKICRALMPTAEGTNPLVPAD